MSIIFETERLFVSELELTDLDLFHDMQSNLNVMGFIRGKAMLFVFTWIEAWYNKRRIHSSLGYKTINEFELEMYNQNVAA